MMFRTLIWLSRWSMRFAQWCHAMAYRTPERAFQRYAKVADQRLAKRAAEIAAAKVRAAAIMDPTV